MKPDMQSHDNLRIVPRPKRKSDYTGRRVRIVREVWNGSFSVPAGTLATVASHSYRGSSLLCDPCRCCRLRAVLSNIAADCFEFVETVGSGA